MQAKHSCIMTSRELVNATFEFRNNGRVPRQMYASPWALIYHEADVEKIRCEFPNDIISSPAFYKTPPVTKGEVTEPGEFFDEWGCTFINYQRGITGEVKNPPITGDEWENMGTFRLPWEIHSIDKEKINEFCAGTDKYVSSGYNIHPFEQLQFLRGTEQLYIDLMLKPKKFMETLEEIHDFYCKLVTKWAETDVDGISLMDDWGSQRSLLINPTIWVEIFKPMYKDYISIAHKHGKKVKMHSDGYILDIIPHLIDVGLEAVNAQIFCMGMDKLKQFRGDITFWGEIDRQDLLPNGSTEDIKKAVLSVREKLWKSGGCIAHCEFGPSAKPENVYQVFKTWEDSGLCHM